MAVPAARLIQDQNLDIRFTGGAILGEKTDGSKAQKKGGGLGSRKALNDISNSAKPSAFQVSKKHNSSNVIAIEKDTVAASKTPFSVGGKPLGSKLPQKGQSGGRKALRDLTNSGKPSLQKVAKSQDKKLSVVSEDIAIEEEGFLHNHQECIKAQKNIMDKESFLNLIGLSDGPPYLPPASKLRPRSPPRHFEMEEIPVPPLDKDWVLKGGRDEYPGFCSPACLSPVSPKLSSAHWNSLWEDKLLDFTIIELPEHPKAAQIL